MSDTSEQFRSPQTGRFLKGHSGNPKGRPRKQTPPADAPQRRMPSIPSKIEPTEPRNADAAMCLLGIAAHDESREGWDEIPALLLEPWAVQAALSQRRGSKALAPKIIGDIKRCTRAHQTLRWPRGTKT